MFWGQPIINTKYSSSRYLISPKPRVNLMSEWACRYKGTTMYMNYQSIDISFDHSFLTQKFVSNFNQFILVLLLLQILRSILLFEIGTWVLIKILSWDYSDLNKLAIIILLIHCEWQLIWTGLWTFAFLRPLWQFIKIFKGDGLLQFRDLNHLMKFNFYKSFFYKFFRCGIIFRRV